jgi:hypothetical protein
VAGYITSEITKRRGLTGLGGQFWLFDRPIGAANGYLKFRFK